MNYVMSAEQMKELDRRTIEEFGISGRILMATAGRAVAEFVKNIITEGKSAVVCGGGNNGGDGYACALYLYGMGIKSDIIEVKNSGHSEDSSYFRSWCIKYCKFKIASEIKNLDEYTIIIDALTGTGFRGKLRNDLDHLINIINSSTASVISVDLPSGLSGDEVYGTCVKADHTITIGYHKPVTCTWPGKQYCGNVTVQKIGFPSIIADDISSDVSVFDTDIIQKTLKYPSQQDKHKYKNGAVLLIAGSDGMEGAAVMAASALFEAGCGIAVLLTTEKSADIIKGYVPELIVRPVGTGAGMEDISSILSTYIVKGFTTVLAGPGLGKGDFAVNSINALFELGHQYAIKAVIDGDAIHLCNDKKMGFRSTVLTPHFGEAADILGIKSSEISQNRLESAKKISEKYGSIVHLKGPYPITSSPSKTYISPTAEQLLATAGSGDVLCGIIASLISKNYFQDDIDAVAAAAEIHSKAAVLTDSIAIRAGDIIKNIRKSMSSFYLKA